MNLIATAQLTPKQKKNKEKKDKQKKTKQKNNNEKQKHEIEIPFNKLPLPEFLQLVNFPMLLENQTSQMITK